MATAGETLQATLSDTAYRALETLADSTTELSGRKVATVLGVSPTTANRALATLAEAGFATSRSSGRATLWQLVVSNPSISAWFEEAASSQTELRRSTGSSPYSTAGGGVRLEHSYAACLIAAFLAGEAVPELGDGVSIDTIRLQASDLSEVDDIFLTGRDANGVVHHSSIAVRRGPALTASDDDSVPLIRDFLTVVTDHWPEASLGRWRGVLAVATNANAVVQLAELAELACSLPSSSELTNRLAQSGRTNAAVRDRFTHIKALVDQASKGLTSADGLGTDELTWRLLSFLSTRNLRLERTDRADRTTAVNTLQRILFDGTPATADALFSHLEELVGRWAPQGAVLTQSVIRRCLSTYPLSRSSRYAAAWELLDRLGDRLRESIRPGLQSALQTLELERSDARSALIAAMRSVGTSVAALVVTGEPDVGKSALALRAVEDLQAEGAAISTLSLRDLPYSPTELEHQLGGVALDELVASGEARPTRLLLVDGAESVLEGKGQVFRAIAAAALKAGFGVAAVTRTDGSRQVRDELQRAMQLAERDGTLAEHVVAQLTDDERQALPSNFAALARLGNDSRASWLLGRPGLVDALLRAGTHLDPADLMCEADVFSAVWRSLIRRDEIHTPAAASPDDREHVALQVARRVLGVPSDPHPGTGAAELRSDGVLRMPNDPALAPGDEFATDLFRDFALCRLFITEGWAPLAAAGAPRWSIRAARLGCQTAMRGPNSSAVWTNMSSTFSELARTEGDRWLEVPYEALLTLGHAETAIRDLWELLTDNNCASLATLLRLAEARYVHATIGDPFALAPVVKITFCERPDIQGNSRLGRRTLREAIKDLVLAWLRGMAGSGRQPDSLRQEVRDLILASDPSLYDDFAVEALACLGADINGQTDAFLRAVAQERPDRLHAAVESAAVTISMSEAQPKLLLDLAEAYYIELPDPGDQWGGRHSLDDGIRDFRHGLGPGFGVPHAAWYYGPFFRLLNTIPVDAIGFINRMLDHAARYRVAHLRTFGHNAGEPDDLEGIRLDLPGIGERFYVGDSHAWAWYRGTTVGPYACMSALLALERFVDHLLVTLDLPAERIVELLLRDCNNLAMLGLVAGVLTRHPDKSGALLDPFLASPAIWHLETARVASDYGFRVRDPDADKLAGEDRRRYTPHETVGRMVVGARLANDDERLAQLQAVGAKLVEAAKTEMAEAGIDDQDYLAMIESWGEEFRIDNYRASREHDQIVIQFERPEHLERLLAPRNTELEATNVLYGLQNRYARHNDSPENWPVGDLNEDLATARNIDGGAQFPDGMPSPEDGLVAVAAAAVRAHALGLATIDASNLEWAIEAILLAAESPKTDFMSFHGSMFAMGSDRAAAASVPLLLLAPFDDLNIDRKRLDNCLRLLARSLFDEVRAIFATGCEPVWAANCDRDGDTGKCRRHHPAWAAALDGLVDCRLGPWNQKAQQRLPVPLPSPFAESLPTVADDALMVNRVRMPLACMVDARQVDCLESDIEDLWFPLWDAHCRGLAHWWREGYDHHAHLNHPPIARRMVDVTLGGDRGPVEAHIRHFASSANALHQLFDGFATTFTYDEQYRRDMDDFWPWALKIALDAIGDGTQVRSERHWFDYMTAALLPTPSPRSWDPDIDGTFARSRADWLQPDALDTLAERWLHLAHWEPKAVDAAIKFAKAAPLEWQATGALTWIESIIDGRFDLFANHLWHLEDWLTGLRSSGVIVGEAKSQYHRIVDGLAAAGDRAAVGLQLLDE
jgi:hypothetical protein